MLPAPYTRRLAIGTKGNLWFFLATHCLAHFKCWCHCIGKGNIPQVMCICVHVCKRIDNGLPYHGDR